MLLYSPFTKLSPCESNEKLYFTSISVFTENYCPLRNICVEDKNENKMTRLGETKTVLHNVNITKKCLETLT